ncbi:alpha/beta hydrolase [Rhizobium sp. BR 317]|uniref:alpha/beta fold hydrolase n=1 Tax=Rhizobium sp. BR 317 TaxID=3040015 RepID=UPI0039BF6898
MAKQVLFVQGAGEGAHARWDSKLVACLERELGETYAVRYPQMPGEDDPHYSAWRAALIREFGSLEDGVLLVGHSIGGTILLHVLAEHPPKAGLGGLFIIAAPFIGEGGWPSDDIDGRKDFSERLPPSVPIYFYHGADDDVVPTAHVQLYAKAIPHAVIRVFDHRDHQLNNDMSDVARDIRSMG